MPEKVGLPEGGPREKVKTMFFCQNCGQQSPKWLGKCPSCGEWNRFVEEEVRDADAARPADVRSTAFPSPSRPSRPMKGSGSGRGSPNWTASWAAGSSPAPPSWSGVIPASENRRCCCRSSKNWPDGACRSSTVSGEESARQIKLRGKRLGAAAKDLLILVEVELENILKPHPGDQTRRSPSSIPSRPSIPPVLSSAPGSVGQVREASGRLILLAKKTGIPIFLVGHVTKDGSIAGPKVLEHMVDTVLYFEGDSGHAYRIIRGIKNRFGPTHEIGVFEMRDTGLTEVANPSAFFLAERPEGAAGSVVVPSMEGTRPILIEVQSLVEPHELRDAEEDGDRRGP